MDSLELEPPEEIIKEIKTVLDEDPNSEGSSFNDLKISPEECNDIIDEKITDMKKRGLKDIKKKEKEKKMKTNKKGEYKKKGKVMYLHKDNIWQRFVKGLYRAFDFIITIPYWETFLNIMGCDLIFYAYLCKNFLFYKLF